MAYLRGRCIHPNVLAFCRREGILYQASFKNHPNCVFVGHDGEGVAKGGSLRGCTQLQFRRDIPGSKKIYPFYMQASTSDKAEALYVDAVGFKDVSRLLPELHDMEVERQEHNLDELER